MHWKLFVSGPWESNWPGASYVYTKEYAQKHQYDVSAISGEEWSFTESFKVKMIELDKDKTMIVLSHNSNTSNKNVLTKCSKTDKTINKLIPYTIDCNFYQYISKKILNKGPALYTPNNSVRLPFWAK